MTSVPSTKKGSANICVSIRAAKVPGERCPCKAAFDSEWCGKHKSTQVRFIAPGAEGSPPVIEHVLDPAPVPNRSEITEKQKVAATKIFKKWRQWLAHRAGPLLWCRDESNNPCDFFSGDFVADIPLREIVSFVSGGKGYIMDIKSANSLIEHAVSAKETPVNPFNRTALPALFVHRITLHQSKKSKTKAPSWAPIVAMSETQKLALAVTDVFSGIESLGYYTNPSWFIDLTRHELQRLYIEIADIWGHRAALSPQDKHRICPAGSPLGMPVTTALIMNQKALRHHVLNTCRTLTAGSPAHSDRQLGVMYVLGALSIVSVGAAAAYPWLVEMFSPGVTRIVGSELVILHPSVMGY